MNTKINVIRVPKPQAGSFNKDRPVSSLLQAQMRHLAEVLKKDIEDELVAVKTEGQASEFVRKFTALLHPQASSEQKRS